MSKGCSTLFNYKKNTGAFRGIFGKMNLTTKKDTTRESNQDIDIWCKVKW